MKYIRYILSILLLAVFGLRGTAVYAQTDNLAGVYGTEFWLAFLSNGGYDPKTEKTFKITLYAVAESPVVLSAYQGTTKLGDFTAVTGGQQYFYKLENLNAASLCPAQDESEKKASRGICIMSKDNKTKFSCYAFIEVGGKTANSMRDATLLLPKDILDKEYFVQMYPDDGKSTEFVVVATEDNTKVNITPSCKTLNGADEGSTLTTTLNKGEVYMVKSQTKLSSTDIVDLSGSTVCADKPVAVFNGNEATKIPYDGSYSASHTFEQCIPQTMWGTEFYVALAGGTLRNRVQVTASYDNTNVTYIRASGTQTVTLNRGQSFVANATLQINQTNSTLIIKSDYPVLCYNYLGCGANNSETVDVGGDEITYNWGNPANALVMPWSHRAKEMSFYTDSIENQTDGLPRKYFVQIVTDKPDDGKIVLDGVALSSTSFKPIGTDMVYTNVELTTHGKHHISTVGQGFTGFVHGMTSEARAYQYTLGFDPPKYLDSLFIANPEDLMSPHSYNKTELPYMENKGWYQRQPEDFPIDEQRIDTAYVCDSTIVNFLGQLAATNAADSIVWKVYLCDKNGEKKGNPVKQVTPATGTTKQTFEYQFIVENQEHLPPEKRDPFSYYSVDMEKYKKHLICTELPPDADTLRTMIRVHREYNDTTWRIICETDTVHFFKESERFVENLTGGGQNKKTIFQFERSSSADNIVAFNSKDNTYSRKYTSINGCDSIVTLKLFACDTVYHRIDTTICQDKANSLVIRDDKGNIRFNPTKYKIKTNSELLKIIQEGGQLESYTNIYYDSLPNMDCRNEPEIQPYLAHKAKYKVCPDTFELRLTIMPMVKFSYVSSNDKYTYTTNQIEWCPGDDPDAVWVWKRSDGTPVNRPDLGIINGEITQAMMLAKENGIGEFVDTLWYNPCPECPDGKCAKEIDYVKLHIATDMSNTVHICQNKSVIYTFGAGRSKTYNGWNYTAEAGQLSPNIAVDETQEITIGSGTEKCTYNSQLILYVHPAYVTDNHLSTRIEYRDTTCIGETKAWKGKEAGHMVWSVSEKKHVDAANLPTQTAGVFEFLDSLTTKTCTECKPEGCDSIERLTLIVGEEKHPEDPFSLCRNKYLEYKWEGTSYYFYGEGYDGDKKDEPNSTLLPDAQWLNEECDGPKVFEKVFEGKTRYGCDSTRTLKIRLNNTAITTKDTSICETQTYDFLGTPYKWDYDPNGTNTYIKTKTIETECGCDEGVTHTIHVFPVYPDITEEPDTTCQVADENAYYTWLNHPRSGEPDRAVWMINTKTNARKKVMTNQIPLSEAGTFTLLDSIHTKACNQCNEDHKGCDSIMSISLTIIPTWNKTFNLSLSSEGYWLWDDTVFVGGSKAIVPSTVHFKEKIVVPAQACYTHTQHHTTRDVLNHGVGTHNTCDSIVTWCIKVGNVFRDTAYAPVCENCDYIWHIEDPNTHRTKDTLITDIPAAGDTIWHYARYKTAMDFDSIYTLVLVGFPTKYNHESDRVCQGEEYTWTGHPGQRDELYIIKGGVATAIKTNDFIKTISQQYGEYLIRDSMTTDTVFYNSGTGRYEEVHCDSIWELTLTVNPTYTWQYNYDKVSFPEDLCSHETLLWEKRLFVGYDYDKEAHPLVEPALTPLYDSIIYIPKAADLLFYDSVPSTGTRFFECDSINYVTIHISHYDTTWLKQHIGDNDSIWFFGGHGGKFNYNGKTKITREDLIPSSSVDYKDKDRHEIFRFFFIDTIPSVLTGCDSIVWDSLYIHPSYRFQFDTLLCSNNDWDWRPESPNANRFKNMNTRVTGFYYDSLSTKPYGIDSVFVLKLIVQPGAKHYFGRNMCKNDTVFWELQTIYYEENKGPVEVKYKTGSECDSVLIFTPVFYDYYHFKEEKLSQLEGFTSDSICQYDTLIWISKGETVPHTKALRGEKGEKFDFLPTDTLGWITIYDSLQTNAPCHCDSIYTLRYFVRPAYRFYDTLTICSNDTLEWRGKVLYSDTAAVIQTYINYHTCSGMCDCDSIYYLTLYVNQAYTSTEIDTICADEQFVWASARDTLLEHLAPGTHFFFDSLHTELECDSIFYLYLTVLDTTREVHYDTICFGDTLHVLNHIYSATGDYKDTTLNADGCHHFIYTHLAVIPPTVPTIWADWMCDQEDAFELHYTYTSHYPLAYSLYFDSLGHDMGFEDMIDVPITEYTDPMVITVPIPLREGQKTKYPRPDVYHFRLVLDNGFCQRPMEDCINDSTFVMNYPAWLIEQHYNDVIALLDSSYNGGYTWTAYQWYKDDSLLVGQDKPYLHIPTGLELGAAYHVRLTRKDEGVAFQTCPIVIGQSLIDPYAPKMGYLSVTPTCINAGHPYVNILSHSPNTDATGNYRITTTDGYLVGEGVFHADVTQVEVPATEGMYIFQLWSNDTPEEPYRAIKIFVRPECPTCDISSF